MVAAQIAVAIHSFTDPTLFHVFLLLCWHFPHRQFAPITRPFWFLHLAVVLSGRLFLFLSLEECGQTNYEHKEKNNHHSCHRDHHDQPQGIGLMGWRVGILTRIPLNADGKFIDGYYKGHVHNNMFPVVSKFGIPSINQWLVQLITLLIQLIQWELILMFDADPSSTMTERNLLYWIVG